MKKFLNIVSLFCKASIIRIDSNGEILDVVINTNPEFPIKNFKNIYDIFTEEEKFRLRRVLESGFDIRKKYMQLSPKTKVDDYVDVQIATHENEKYIYIEFFESNREREVMYDRYIEKLTNLSEKDPLTKVYNRQGLDEKIRRLILNSDDEKRIGVIYFDMDNLKQINDTHGHKTGDKAILNVIEILISNLRDRDIVARLGGDEFVIVVEELTGKRSTTYGLAKRLHKAVARSKKEKHSTTLSMGVHMMEAKTLKKDVEDLEKFSKQWNKQLDKADKAAYKSKKSGKNKISTSRSFSKFYKL